MITSRKVTLEQAGIEYIDERHRLTSFEPTCQTGQVRMIGEKMYYCSYSFKKLVQRFFLPDKCTYNCTWVEWGYNTRSRFEEMEKNIEQLNTFREYMEKWLQEPSTWATQDNLDTLARDMKTLYIKMSIMRDDINNMMPARDAKKSMCEVNNE